jgi:hypothetical protein
MEVTDSMLDAAIAEYRLALSSDPRNTDQMRNSPAWPRIMQAMQRDAMREALAAALANSVSA